MRRRKPWKIGEEKILGKERVSAGVLSLIYSGKQEGYESGREYTKMEQGGVQKSDPIESCCCSIANSYPTLCDPMDCSTPGSPTLHISQSLLSFMSIESVMLSSHLILCCPLLLLLSVFPSIRVFSHESAPFNEYSRLICFRIDWFDSLAVQGTLKSLLQHHNSKVLILWYSASFMVQLSHLYMTTSIIQA